MTGATKRAAMARISGVASSRLVSLSGRNSVESVLLAELSYSTRMISRSSSVSSMLKCCAIFSQIASGNRV